jgi:hypothetical protein
MTLQYMEGFENLIESSDLKARGWLTSTLTNVAGTGVLSVPSRTGTPGRGLMLRGPYSTSAILPFTASNSTDFGMFAVGRSIYSLWQSGGFSVGYNATFNKVNTLQVAAWYPNQIAYDGSQYYWAIISQAVQGGGLTYYVAYSTDLQNWTPTLTQPATMSAQGWNCGILVVGTGLSATVIVVPNYYSTYSAATKLAPTYTTNAGSTWTLMSVGAGITANGSIAATGNPSFPFAGVVTNANNVNVPSVWTSLTAVPTLLTNSLGTSSAGNSDWEISSIARLKNGFVCLSSANNAGNYPGNTLGNSSNVSNWLVAPANGALGTAATWISSPTIAGEQSDITFFNNLWISVGYGGLFTSPNSGSVGTPAGPTAAWSNLISTGAGNGLNGIDNNGTICVAVGQDPANTSSGVIYTSTNGTTWTKVDRLITTGAAGVYFSAVIWDGSRFIIFGGLNNNVIATSLDGVAWTPVYYPDYPEALDGTSASCMGAYSGTISAAGVYVPWGLLSSEVVGQVLYTTAVSAGTRAVTPSDVAGNGATGAGTSVNVTINPLAHYYEIIATATASANCFNFSWAVDGVVVGPMVDPGFPFALASDTGTAQLLINLPRNGQWTVIDDIYVTDFAADPVGNTGQLGIVNIVGGIPTSDVQDQFTLTGSAATHAAQVAGALSNSEGAISSYTVGAKDLYGMTNNIPANYRIQAVQVEGFFQKYGNSGASGTLGIVSGAKETDGGAVAALTVNPVFATSLQSVDPNTNAQWSITALNAAKVAVTKTT